MDRLKGPLNRPGFLSHIIRLLAGDPAGIDAILAGRNPINSESSIGIKLRRIGKAELPARGKLTAGKNYQNAEEKASPVSGNQLPPCVQVQIAQCLLKWHP